VAEVEVKAAIAALRRFGDDAKNDIKDVNREAAKLVETRAKQIVPVRTGALQQTIRSSGQLGKGVVRAGKAKTPYANPIHWGWPTRPSRKWGTPGRIGGGPFGANRFLTDAVDDERRSIVKLYERELERLARKYG
jgi:hypothetical protein